MPEIVLEESATEVAIPSLPEDGAAASLSPKPLSSPRARKAPPNLPAIAVSKPPAPLPLELPTPRDIAALPSPPDSAHSSFDDDLESGRSPRTQIMREQEAMVSKKSVKSPSIIFENADASGSHPSPIAARASPTLLGRMSPPPENDLLVDTAPSETTPIMESNPLPPRSSTPPPSKTDILVDDKVEEDVDPDMTIRLVGGGGQTGVADLIGSTEGAEVLPDGEAEADGNDAASITSDTNAAGTKDSEGKKHKKTKSGLAGLRKTLGGLRKKDSDSASVHDGAVESTGNQ